MSSSDSVLYNPYNPKNRLFTITDVQTILKCTSYIPRDCRIYQTAMVHSSYVKRSEYITPTGEPTELAARPTDCLELFVESYERLEHLGDSVLGVAVSSYLIKRFPSENEGFLTNLRKEIVCNENLGHLCQKIGLDRFYVISKHNEEACNGRFNIQKLGDILEAFIGALWIDSDYDFRTVYKFVTYLIETYINIPKLLMNNRNYKEQLQKMYQSRYKYTPKYVMLESSTNLYTMAVCDQHGKHIGIATATTKKQAEQIAAKKAIEKLS